MKANTQKKLYIIDRVCGKILNGFVLAMLFLSLLAGICALLRYFDISFAQSAVWGILVIVYKSAWAICGIAAGMCILCRICLSPFVKSEEEEDFEKKVEYILQQKKADGPLPSNYSPFRNLSSLQEGLIEQLLHDLPANANKPNAINLALIAQYLTALEKLGKANLADKRALRLWVKHITGKQVPSSSQFNEAVPSTTTSKVSQAKRTLEPIIQLQSK